MTDSPPPPHNWRTNKLDEPILRKFLFNFTLKKKFIRFFQILSYEKMQQPPEMKYTKFYYQIDPRFRPLELCTYGRRQTDPTPFIFNES